MTNEELIDLFDAKLAIRDAKILANRELIEQKFQSLEEALELAREDLHQKLLDLNDVRLRFMPRNEYEAKHEILITRLEALEKFQTNEVGEGKGLNLAWVWIIGGITSLSSVIALLLNAFRLFNGGK